MESRRRISEALGLFFFIFIFFQTWQPYLKEDGQKYQSTRDMQYNNILCLPIKVVQRFINILPIPGFLS